MNTPVETSKSALRIAIVGGGAAGCFAAIELKCRVPSARVTVYESGNRLLAKVAITGGGRCNLTNSFASVSSLEQVYPRGARLMSRLFHEFDQHAAMRWFETHGVRLVTQPDQCVFPVSQDAMQVVNCLISAMQNVGVEVRTNARVQMVEHLSDGQYQLTFASKALTAVLADKVVVTTGGSSTHASMLGLIDSLGVKVEEPVPSLFSLAVDNAELTSLMGLVVQASVSLPGTKFRADGALLITHWGLSGPAVLRLSSYAARHLAQMDYNCKISVNWLSCNEAQAGEIVDALIASNAGKRIAGVRPDGMQERLWLYVLGRCGLRADLRCSELGRKGRNSLVSVLTADVLDVTGKSRYRDEFVTCGGVSLKAVDQRTLECKQHAGLYFAGEVLDVDAVTGGFNLQAAWTTGYVVASGIARSLK